jgi:hypothetical protein
MVKPAPDNEFRQHNARFAVLLAVAQSPEDFMHEWDTTKESHMPRVQEAEHVKRGDKVGALVLFSGCAAEGETCDAVVDFKA